MKTIRKDIKMNKHLKLFVEDFKEKYFSLNKDEYVLKTLIDEFDEKYILNQIDHYILNFRTTYRKIDTAGMYYTDKDLKIKRQLEKFKKRYELKSYAEVLYILINSYINKIHIDKLNIKDTDNYTSEDLENEFNVDEFDSVDILKYIKKDEDTELDKLKSYIIQEQKNIINGALFLVAGLVIGITIF